MQDEVELIPVSPLRRLEKRIERLESYSSEDPKSIMRDILDIVRMHQQIVDEMAKSNDALRVELAKLPGRVEELISGVRELVSLIKTSTEEEVVGMTEESMKPLLEKLDELVKSNKSIGDKNEAMLSLLSDLDKKMKRSVVAPPRLQRPLPSPRPQLPQRPQLKRA